MDQIQTIKSNRRGGDLAKQVEKQLRGQVVLTRYNNRTYRIDGIEWNMNPNSLFQYKNGKISYTEYYQTHYQLRVSDLQQPLLLHVQRRKSGNDKIYLLPEFCSMTGLFVFSFFFSQISTSQTGLKNGEF